jgi:hypothetical protein
MIFLLLLCSASMTEAETYRWIDDQGVANFTDDPILIPSRYRSKAVPQSGDQTDPTSPSMIQPTPEPLGDQPEPSPLGMKQPTPEPLGVQPEQTSPGMKQPTPEPLGDQPETSPSGMKQPTPVQ